MPKTNSKKKKTATKNRSIVIGVVLLVALIAIAGITAFGKTKDKANKQTTNAATSSAQQTTAVPTTQIEQVRFINPLTGLGGFDAGARGKRPIAVMVENSPEARPQWGLCSPDIVIEGLVEGGITRMLWLYADVNKIPKVGPIRSARHDFLEMAEGFNAVFVHWGGSHYAYDALKRRNVDDIDGMKGKYFFRDKSRGVGSEHTGYSNGEALAKAIAEKKIKQAINPAYAKPFIFTAPGTAITPVGGDCRNIFIQFSSAYKHNFKFDPGDKLYYNNMNAKPMVEAGNKQMAVTNVLVLYCPVTQLGNQGHIEMDLTGGKGVFASNGSCEDITWKKSNTPGAMLKLYAADGSELVLNTGKSYIGFVPAVQSAKTTVGTN